MDRLFVDEAPEWLNYMFEILTRDIENELEQNSEFYKKIKSGKEEIYDTFPVFSQLIEVSDDKNGISLTANESIKFAELIHAESEIVEMIQRMLYIKGLRDGILFAKYSGLLND